MPTLSQQSQCTLAKKLKSARLHRRHAARQKKQLKTDKAALKEARAAFKALKEAAVTSQKADDDALAAMTAACPVAEPPQDPDVGCSTTIVSDNAHPMNANDQSSLIVRGFPTGPGWYGFQKIVNGSGNTPAGGKKLGVGVMQPCSQAWTVGKYLTNPGIDWTTGRYVGKWASLGAAYLEKKSGPNGFKTACECREWAETVMPWPKGQVVQFKGVRSGAYYGGESVCRVWRTVTPEEMPLKEGGFTLVNSYAYDGFSSCYLGNPEEWQSRVDAAKAEVTPKIIDNCRKDYWAEGKFETNWGVYQHPVGTLKTPDPYYNTIEGRKMCLKWTKADPKCDKAVGIMLNSLGGGTCQCFFSVSSAGVPRLETTRPSTTVCLL